MKFVAPSARLRVSWQGTLSVCLGLLLLVSLPGCRGCLGVDPVAEREKKKKQEEEKQLQIKNLENYQNANGANTENALKQLQHGAVNQENLFELMMDAVKYCSLGQITNALFEVGGMYRRNM